LSFRDRTFKGDRRMNESWNPWKLTAIGMGLVGVTALVTGLVVANWSGSERDAKAVDAKATTTESAPPASARAAAPTSPPHRAAVASHAPGAPVVPPQAAVNACNQYAQESTREKTIEVVKDAAIGAAVGAAAGAAGGAIASGGKGAGKGAAIGGVLGAGGGTLYGLNENKKHDEQYRVAYGQCMRSRGYTG
jgi:hypothetical protein